MQHWNRNLNFSDWLSDLFAAISLLTRIPVPIKGWAVRPQSAWAWPIVGAGIGTIAGAVIWFSIYVGLTQSAAAILGVIIIVLLTGCLHEDGLADAADGFWGGQYVEQRLRIMRDSRIGTYGVSALIIIFIARFASISSLIDNINPIIILAATGMLSRATMLVAMHFCPQARIDGLAVSCGIPPISTVWTGVILAAILGLTLLKFNFIIPTLAAAAAGVAMSFVAMRKIGGHTGDTLGATQQTAETASLLSLTITI